MSEPSVEFVIAPEESGLRLDQVLTRRVSGLGRKRAAELFRAGAVRVDGHPAAKGALARPGSILTADLPAPDRALPEPDVQLDVLLETPTLVAVDKPAGRPSAALRASDRGTMAGALVARYPEMEGVGYGPREPGLIHRLDTQTSGVLIFARSQPSFEALRQALESGAMVKKYLAIVASDAIDEHGLIHGALAPSPQGKRVRVVPPDTRGAREARTEYRVVERCGRWALVEATAGRAYRHQVRVHLASRGSPIAGDTLYGGQRLRLGERHALHASHVACETAEVPRFEVDSPLPKDLADLFARG